MKKLIITIILLSTLIFNIGCQSKTDTATPEYQDIKPQVAHERLEKEKNIVLLDVRTMEEYQESHISNSILIPLDNLKEQVTETIQDKDTVIFVYCRSGNRSTEAAKILVDLGYTKVFNIDGGIKNWPYETETN